MVMNMVPTIAKLPGAAGELETFAMANCLMILSKQKNAVPAAMAGGGNGEEEEIGRSYPCKTCGRKFQSFQALGGHRASHKKIKPESEIEVSNVLVKPKVHACSICGVEFPIGQALGGHMRRHRGLLSGGGSGGGDASGAIVVSSVTTEGSTGDSDGNNRTTTQYSPIEKKRKMVDISNNVPVLNKSTNRKRVCLDLDLSLTLWGKQDEIEEECVNNLIEEGEIIEQGFSVKDEDVDDFLKLELRCRPSIC